MSSDLRETDRKRCPETLYRSMATTPQTMSPDLEPPELDAFEHLYRAMLPTVYRYATARLGRSEGEDVTSEVFHAAAIAFVDGRREQVTDAWLMAVARNRVIDRWRKAERRSALAHLVHRRQDEQVAFPEDWTSTTTRERVLDALDSMTSRHRGLLVAHYVDGIPAKELAEYLGTTASAVESALARARASFRRHYDDQRGWNRDERR